MLVSNDSGRTLLAASGAPVSRYRQDAGKYGQQPNNFIEGWWIGQTAGARADWKTFIGSGIFRSSGTSKMGGRAEAKAGRTGTIRIRSHPNEDRFAQRRASAAVRLQRHYPQLGHLQAAGGGSSRSAQTEFRGRPPSRSQRSWRAVQGGLRLSLGALRLLARRTAGHESSLGHVWRKSDYGRVARTRSPHRRPPADRQRHRHGPAAASSLLQTGGEVSARRHD